MPKKDDQTIRSQAFYALAARAAKIEQSGKALIKLNMGNTAIPVPQEALRELRRYPQQVFAPYGDPCGELKLRTLIARREKCSPDSVIVGPGSKFLLYGILNILRPQAKRIVLPAPFWPAYTLLPAALQIPYKITPSFFEDDWELPKIALKPGDVVLISDPCNPTGKALSKGTINLLCKQAAKVSADIIWDEAYRGFMRNASAHPFGIRVRSFSKEFHLEGWRIGYAIVPEELRTALVKFIVTTVTAVSEPMQRVAYACLTAERAIMRRNLPLWEQRLNFLSARLKKLGFEFHVPDCGMYIFARHPRIDDATVFCERALEKGLALAPGIAFGPYPEFIRISAAASREEMKRAMNIVAECLS